ncbi:MAG: arylsulfotransferase family protein [Pseudomonadota bacterium]
MKFWFRPVPMWLVCFAVLMLLLFVVLFGWAVRHELTGGKRLGPFGAGALQVAAFPSLVLDVFEKFSQISSGDADDISFRTPREEQDLARFSLIKNSTDFSSPGLLISVDPLIAETGRRIIAGTFDIDNRVQNAIIFLSPEFVVERIIPLSETAVDGEDPRPMGKKFVHGVEILDDGSIIFAFDGGISLQRFDACGRRIWTQRGDFHHAVTLDPSGAGVWTFNNRDIVLISIADGQTLKTISVEQIVDQNPQIEILEVRRAYETSLGKNLRNITGEWLADAIHWNDVDPLTPELAPAFPKFEPGDLLLSARSLNLVFILDPNDAKVKWWRSGAVQRQHDPDWFPDGRLSIFNNRMSRDFSQIVALDVEDFSTEVFVDGRTHNFYTRIRGKHQWLANGNVAVTSPQQGRAFEVTNDGRLALELLNTKPESADTNYTISEVRWLPDSYFKKGISQCEQAENVG